MDSRTCAGGGAKIIIQLMKVYNIGRKGNQNFPLDKKEKVNDLHARLVVSDDGVWTLEDLGSLNGTFIITENGEQVEVRKKQITEFTRIVLADTSVMGASFFAHHLVEHDPDDYRKEFRHLVRQHGIVSRQKAAMEESIKQRRMFLSILPAVTSSFMGVSARLLFGNSSNIVYIIIGMMSAVTAVLNMVIAWYNNRDKSLKVFSMRMQNLLLCPRCGFPLSDYNLQSQQCPACKAHA